MTGSREAELLEQITDLKARLIVAERDLADVKALLERERQSLQNMMRDPDEFLHILGIKLGDVKTIQREIAEWNRAGGRPDLIERVREEHRLRDRIAELEGRS